MSDFLTLQAAADRLGVHYMTAYRYVRLGQLAAHKEGGTWRIAEGDLELFQHENGSECSPAVSRRNAPWHQRFENRLLEGDQSGAWKVIEAAMSAGITPLGVYEEVFVPALRSIGDRWADGEIDVGEEHQASAIVGRLIGRLGPRFYRRGRRRGSVAVAAPPGELHGLGLAMTCDVLHSGGYAALDLGPDLPVEALDHALQRLPEIAGVCIGVMNSDALDECRRMVVAARRRLPDSAPVVVGGGAIADEGHARRLGAERAATLPTVVAAIDAGRDAVPAVTV